jgi:hypothetical protein
MTCCKVLNGHMARLTVYRSCHMAHQPYLINHTIHNMKRWEPACRMLQTLNLHAYLPLALVSQPGSGTMVSSCFSYIWVFFSSVSCVLVICFPFQSLLRVKELPGKPPPERILARRAFGALWPALRGKFETSTVLVLGWICNTVISFKFQWSTQLDLELNQR